MRTIIFILGLTLAAPLLASDYYQDDLMGLTGIWEKRQPITTSEDEKKELPKRLDENRPKPAASTSSQVTNQPEGLLKRLASVASFSSFLKEPAKPLVEEKISEPHPKASSQVRNEPTLSKQQRWAASRESTASKSVASLPSFGKEQPKALTHKTTALPTTPSPNVNQVNNRRRWANRINRLDNTLVIELYSSKRVANNSASKPSSSVNTQEIEELIKDALKLYNGKTFEEDKKKAFKLFESANEKIELLYKPALTLYEGSSVEEDRMRMVEVFESVAAIAALNISNENLLPDIKKKIVHSQYILWSIYQRSWSGIDHDKKKASKWLQKAANNGHPEAEFDFANYMSTHYTGLTNEQLVISFYQRAVRHGHTQAPNTLGLMFEHGKGCNKDQERAYELYQIGDNRDDPLATYNLAKCLQKGKVLPKNDENHKTAVNLFVKLAGQGNVRAQKQLGKCYERGYGVTKDAPTAAGWYATAARNNHKKAPYLKAVCLLRSKLPGYEDQVDFLKEGALQGSPEAQYQLGRCTRRGWGFEENREVAIEWIMKAANTGHKRANYVVALYLLCREQESEGKEKVKVIKWLNKAIEKGFTKAQYALGRCFERGLGGVREDPEEAAKWILTAAQSGYSKARYDYGDCLLKGIGVKKNEEDAKLWFEKAAQQGLELAKEKLARLRRDEIAQGKKS